MSIHQSRNVRIVTCDGYCEELEASPKETLPDAVANRDAEIRRDIESELQWDPRIDDRKVGIVVHHGVVTLTGEVASYAGRCAVEDIARRIAGVQAIANEVLVNLPRCGVRSDVDIAEAARNVLRRHVMTRCSGIQPSVSHGEVTLHGHVAWKFQKEAAGRLIALLAGVRHVVNLIQIDRLLKAHGAFDRSRL
jgi:osmotically-inducible protein OsmY